MLSIDVDFVEVSIFAGQVIAAWIVVIAVAMLVRRLIRSGIRRALGSAPIGNDASRRQQRG
ncbi:MAG: hypothetical protein ACO3V2_08945, partial [Ilumatobacteraceae bacterium]